MYNCFFYVPEAFRDAANKLGAFNDYGPDSYSAQLEDADGNVFYAGCGTAPEAFKKGLAALVATKGAAITDEALTVADLSRAELQALLPQITIHYSDSQTERRSELAGQVMKKAGLRSPTVEPS